jgi:hypothetical protein
MVSDVACCLMIVVRLGGVREPVHAVPCVGTMLLH